MSTNQPHESRAFFCPECGKPLSAMTGTRIECHHCGQALEVVAAGGGLPVLPTSSHPATPPTVIHQHFHAAPVSVPQRGRVGHQVFGVMLLFLIVAFAALAATSTMSESKSWMAGFGIWLAIGGAYCLPMISAGMSRHPQTSAIALVNVLLGWTAIGWIVALIWAVMVPKRQDA